MRLKDKAALITGGARGIGRCTAEKFAAEGAFVTVADKDVAGCEEVVKHIERAGGEAQAAFLDTTDAKSVQGVIDRIKERCGGLDILVNNAGITRDAKFEKMEDDDFDAVISVNLKGVYLCSRYALDAMRMRKGGVILNASSFVGIYGNYGQTNYAASKFGVIGMTKTWAKELGPEGIRVNAVAPGFIRTPMTEKVPDKVLDKLVKQCPLRRLGAPDDIASAYLFLASDEAAYINGAVLEVTGGLTV